MGCPNCLKRLVARMSPCLRLAPTVPAGNRVARKYDPLLLTAGERQISSYNVLSRCIQH